mgnify:CR=1 FL=1
MGSGQLAEATPVPGVEKTVISRPDPAYDWGMAHRAADLRATAQLDAAQRSRLCVMLMYPNLYASAEALADADYLETGRLDGLRIRVLQPRRSAATPWLPGLLDHLTLQGATVSHTMLENLREAFWARETPTDYETAESGRLDTMLLHEMNAEGCK